MAETNRIISFKSGFYVGQSIINDSNIDFYTLGVYTRLCYYIDSGLDYQMLYTQGKEEYINKALDKLLEAGYISKTEQEDE